MFTAKFVKPKPLTLSTKVKCQAKVELTVRQIRLFGGDFVNQPSNTIFLDIVFDYFYTYKPTIMSHILAIVQ